MTELEDLRIFLGGGNGQEIGHGMQFQDEVLPEQKGEIVKRLQAEGRIVAMAETIKQEIFNE